MVDYTSAQLLAVINTVTSPFANTLFFKQPQIATQRMYPSVEIQNIQPEAPTETTQLKRYNTRFEIRVYIRYGDRSADTDNLRTLERNLLTLLLGTVFNDLKMITETEDFVRGPIKDNPLNVDGIQSIITLSFEELEATVGIIGLQQTLDIGSIMGLQIISEISDEGRNSTRRADDSGTSKVTKGMKRGAKFLEYMYTKANFDTIATLIDADNEISGTLTEGATTRVMTIKPVYQRTAVRLDGQKTVILQLEIISG